MKKLKGYWDVCKSQELDAVLQGKVCHTWRIWNHPPSLWRKSLSSNDLFTSYSSEELIIGRVESVRKQKEKYLISVHISLNRPLKTHKLRNVSQLQLCLWTLPSRYCGQSLFVVNKGAEIPDDDWFTDRPAKHPFIQLDRTVGENYNKFGCLVKLSIKDIWGCSC